MSGSAILGALLAVLPDETIKEAADFILDKAENLVEKTPTKIDDAIVLPLIGKARQVFGIPDNDPAPAAGVE